MKDSMSRRAQDPVETLWQAKTFDTTKRHYERLGLCRVCAAQASFGHQQGLGFSQIKPPCHKCQPIVDTFPVDKPGLWRSCSRRRGAKFSSSIRSEKG